jgi:glutathione synthase/RimK-type ligase-like ATP-grasp enzyme
MTIPLYWVRPQRDRPHEAVEQATETWEPYRAQSAASGFDFQVIDGDDIVVWRRADDVTVYVKGQKVTRDAVAFHTKLISWPDYEKDIWRFLSTFAILRDAGYYTTIPPMCSIVNNDKLLTYLQPWAAGLPMLPSVRLLTRHFVSLSDFIDPDDIEYPVLVKPSCWGGGMGVLRAEDRATLEAALQLAASAEIPMLIQPWVPGVSDWRIYCIDGEPVRAKVRSALQHRFAANVMQSGTTKVCMVPDWLLGPARQVAAGLGLPFVCVDFLANEDQYYFSEIEIDGAIGGTPEELEILRMRFAAMRKHFDQFQEQR